MYLCPNHKKCKVKLFAEKLNNMAGMVYLIEHEFCFVNYERCARFKAGRKVGIEKVPENLFPTQAGMVDEFLKNPDTDTKKKKTA
jgi:hypothetical protein